MSHATLQGAYSPDSILFGTNFYSQRITIEGGGTGYWYATYLDSRTELLSTSATAQQVEDALRELPYLLDVEVTSSTTGTWDVTAGANSALIQMLICYGEFTTGTLPYVSVTELAKRPLEWKLPRTDSVGIGSVSPTVGRTDFGNLPTRQTQTKATEWFGGHDVGGGFGRKYYKERETVNEVWETGLWTHVRDGITLPGLEEAETLGSGLSGSYGLTNIAIGRTTNGVRLVGMMDTTGAGTVGKPVYYNTSTETWTVIPGSSMATSAGTDADIAFFKGVMYMSWPDGANAGYITWDGNTGGAATKLAISSGQHVLSFCIWDNKLFRVTPDGVMKYCTATPASESDWIAPKNGTTDVVYTGIGYPYALVNFRSLNGVILPHLVATDGIYFFENFEAGVFVQRAKFNTANVWGSRLPQANSVKEWNGDLYLVVGGKIRRYDGQNFSIVDIRAKEGITSTGLEFNKALEVRSLGVSEFLLFANCTVPYGSGTATALAANTTLAVGTSTTYYGTSSLADDGGVGHDYTVTMNGDVRLMDSPVPYYGTVFGYDGQGWHTIVPMVGTTSTPIGILASLYHELLPQHRLVFGPGYAMAFEDQPGSPQYWTTIPAYTATTRNIVTAFYDRDLVDVPKIAYMLRTGYEDCGGDNSITPYFEINDAPDRTDGTAGNDPTQYWTRLLDTEGAVSAISAGAGKPEAGIDVSFFEHHDEPSHATHGYPFYSLRLRYALSNSGNTSTSPRLKFWSLVHGAKFGPLFSFPLDLDIGVVSPDGRDTHRQRIDLEQLYRSSQLIDISFHPNDWFQVNVDFLRISSLSAGNNESFNASPRASLTVSQMVQEKNIASH